jgi:hypothetical protein
VRTGGRIRGRRAASAAPLLLCCLLAACATIEPPRGGPADETPPDVVSVTPDSGTVGLSGLDRIEIEFSEKVDPSPAARFIHFYPALDVKGTKWSGRRRATISFHAPLPPDTVIVVEIPKGHTDVHRVKSITSRRYPLATTDSLPDGEITGLLMFGEEPGSWAVVELYSVPPDTLEYFRQDILRRTEADSTGRFVLPWLMVPGGPYLLRAFVDNNDDLRPADNEPQRLLPLTVDLTSETPTVDVGRHVIYSPQTPGRLLGRLVAELDTRTLFGWTEKIAEADTGFVPAHASRMPNGQAGVTSGDTTIFDPAGPGPIRAIVFADLDGDSLLSALPDSTALPDSVIWRWEPYATADTLTVEAGLDLYSLLPAPGDSLRPCATPPPVNAVLPDTMTAAADSTLGALDTTNSLPDSLTAPVEPDSTLVGEEETP